MPVPNYLKRIIVKNEDTGDEYTFTRGSDARVKLVSLLCSGYLAVMFTAKVF